MYDDYASPNGDVGGSDQEREYFLKVLNTFQSYRKQALLRIERTEQCLSSLPEEHQLWLKKYWEDLQSFRRCIDGNADLITLFLHDSQNMFLNLKNDRDQPSHVNGDADLTLSEGVDKVQSVFKQLMRYWSSHGAAEREQSYKLIVDELLLQFPDIGKKNAVDRSLLHVLVPGAGLGRLAFEISNLGFNCQGNEFNLFMLIVSYFVLNKCQKVDQYEIFPWIHQYCNNLNGENQTESVRFPDVKPTARDSVDFSMCAGDFLEIYQKENDWNCVATCFFIDCASNVVQFIERIYKILVPGGIWINLGPLLYHYSDMKNHESIEPSFEVICQVIEQVGFIMEKCCTGVKSRYCQNPKSMLQYEYDSVFFVCKKRTAEQLLL